MAGKFDLYEPQTPEQVEDFDNAYKEMETLLTTLETHLNEFRIQWGKWRHHFEYLGANDIEVVDAVCKATDELMGIER